MSAPVGRWQKGKDLQWYAKASPQELAIALQEEKDRIRASDDDVINEALGLKPKRKRIIETQLDSAEVKQFLSRGGMETERSSVDIERVQGLGAAPVKVHDHIERLTSIEKDIKKLQEQQAKAGEIQVTTICVVIETVIFSHAFIK